MRPKYLEESNWVRENSSDWTTVVDLDSNNKKITLTRGGLGGKGNIHFVKPTNRAPEERTLGQAVDVNN